MDPALASYWNQISNDFYSLTNPEISQMLKEDKSTPEEIRIKMRAIDKMGHLLKRPTRR